MVVGFLGNLLFGTLVNPPTTSIVVARVEIPVGTILTREMLGVDDMRLNNQVAAVLVQEADLPLIVGGMNVETIHAFQPVHLSSIVADGNPAAAGRLSLTLTDPDVVAMVIPVNAETAPQSIAAGDYIDLNFGVGSATFLAGTLSTAPTPQPFQPLPGFVAQSRTGLDGVTIPAPQFTAGPTPTEEPRISLPVAKTIVHTARVLSVVSDDVPNPAYLGPDGNELATEQGAPIALVVAVPRDAEEIVHFAIVNGSIHVALLSPQNDNVAEAGQRIPTLGMSWDDMVALFRLERDAALEDGLPEVLRGPGAAAVKATMDAVRALTEAPLLPTPTPGLELPALATPAVEADAAAAATTPSPSG